MNDTTDQSSLPHNSLLELYEDKTGTLWAGSLGGGLIKVLRKNGKVIGFKNYTMDDGMPDNVI